MRFCPECGYSLEGTPKFCPECGVGLESEAGGTDAKTAESDGHAADATTEKAPRRMRGRAIVIAAIALLVITAGSAFAWHVSSTIPVPAMLGQTLDEASEQIQAAGLVVGAVTYDESAQGEVGTVYLQEPGAGKRVSEGESVSLVIVGPPPVITPDLAGLGADEAEARLAEIGLEAGDVTESFDATVSAGLLISQDPIAGEEVPRDTAVDLVFSKGPQPVPVPSVVGETKESATASLEEAGLVVEVQEQSSDVEKGNVIAQNPADGELLPGSVVTITVSTGVEMVRVPDVIAAVQNSFSSWTDGDWTDHSASVARRTLSNVGLGASIAFDQMTGPSQRPQAGSMVPRGTVVTVVLLYGE